MTPIAAALALPPVWAVLLSFSSIFVLWCIHFNALDLEFPFGNRVNDLPMNEFQSDWNQSLLTLLNVKGVEPPSFNFNASIHEELAIVMSDASELYVPKQAAGPMATSRAVCSMIRIAPAASYEAKAGKKTSRKSVGMV